MPAYVIQIGKTDKISQIKTFRTITGLGLADSKDKIEEARKPYLYADCEVLVRMDLPFEKSQVALINLGLKSSPMRASVVPVIPWPMSTGYWTMCTTGSDVPVRIEVFCVTDYNGCQSYHYALPDEAGKCDRRKLIRLVDNRSAWFYRPPQAG